MLRNISLLVASLFCGLMLLEFSLRLLGWTFPVFAQPDLEFGWSFRPHVSGWSSHENTVYLRINRFGFRGGDWPQQPPASRFRIAVIGDSFVDSSNLPEEVSFTSMIEKHLESCPVLGASRAEVLNLGVSGYGTAQQFLLLHRAIEFRPNLILLAFYVGNDIADNSRTLSLESQRERPYFIELPSGELHLDTSFRDNDAFRRALTNDWQKRLVNASYLLQALKQLYFGKPIRPSAKSLHAAYGKVTEDALLKPEDTELFSPPTDDAWRSAWSVTERLLTRMSDWTRTRNLDFALVIIPQSVEVLPTERLRSVAAQRFGLADLDYPVDRIARWAAQSEIPFFSLLSSLRTAATSEQAFLYGFPPYLGHGHLNATGAEASGRSVAHWLCERLGKSTT
jgi:lysophospholipase L1-like esterase